MKDESNKKSTMIAFSIVSIMIFLSLYVDIKGNPLKIYEFKRGAEKYILEKYPMYDFYVDSIEFYSESKIYSINIKSKTSRDRFFDINIDENSSFDKEKRDSRDNNASLLFEDNYERNMRSGVTTFTRVSEEYSEFLKNEVKDKFSIRLKSVSGWLGSIFAKDEEALKSVDFFSGRLELDKEYDVRELGKLGGHIILVFDGEEISEEIVAKMLLEVKEYCDKNNIYFSAISMKIFGRYDIDIEIKHFFYDDIYEEGLVDRVKKHIEELY